MPISEETLDAMSAPELNELASRASAKARAKERQLTITSNLHGFLIRLTESIQHNLAQPEGSRKETLDFPVVETRQCFKASEILAIPGYAEGIRQLGRKLGVLIEIYDGKSPISNYRETDYENDARVKIHFPVEGKPGSPVNIVNTIMQEISR